MNWKIAVPILALTHAAVGAGGFLFARSLLLKDPAWQQANQAREETQAKIDRAGGASSGSTTPPADFVPRVVAFEIDGNGKSSVAFTSDAPLEKIVGTTSTVKGRLTVDASALEKSTAGPIAVGVGTLKTGIEKRDEHLQGEGWFDTASHPEAVFTLERIEPGAGGIWPGRVVDVTIHGSLAIKGKSRHVQTTATVSWAALNDKLKEFGFKGDVLRVKTRFDVKLSDFGMSAEVIGQKVAEVVQIDLNLTALEVK